jgi:hypothetical protein
VLECPGPLLKSADDLNEVEEVEEEKRGILPGT